MRARSSGWLLLGLVVLSSLVAAELHYGVGRGPGTRTVGQGGASSEAVAVPLFALADRDAFSVTVTRPLFMPNRRPLEADSAPAVVEAPKAAQPSADRYALSAIVIVDDERIALLADSATGSLIRAREGETLAGWRIEKILEDGAVLRNGETRAELTLRTFGPPAPPPATPRRRTRSDTASTARRDAERPASAPKRPRRFRRPANPQRQAADNETN